MKADQSEKKLLEAATQICFCGPVVWGLVILQDGFDISFWFWLVSVSFYFPRKSTEAQWESNQIVFL